MIPDLRSHMQGSALLGVHSSFLLFLPFIKPTSSISDPGPAPEHIHSSLWSRSGIASRLGSNLLLG